jgi:hypothetical protein
MPLEKGLSLEGLEGWASAFLHGDIVTSLPNHKSQRLKYNKNKF